MQRALGQHATRPDVADLLATLCLLDPGARVLDPACGSGALLLAARRRAALLGGEGPELTGVEVDPRLAREAGGALPGARILRGDFLKMSAGSFGLDAPFDAVLGNPPYVRQEHLPASRRAGRADLHIRFWLPAASLLRPGGRLGFLTSSMWLDAGYGAGLREWLARGFVMVALIEPQRESWFDAARVRTVICVLEKRAPGPRALTRALRLAPRLEEIAPARLAARQRMARLESLRQRIEAAPAAVSLHAPRWGSLLRGSALRDEIIAAAGDRLVPLSEVAAVRWGIKSGDDALFFPRRSAPPPVEARHLVPAVHSLMDLDRVVVTEDQLRRFLLSIDTRQGKPGRLVRHMLRQAERERASHRRPTCAQRERVGAAPRRWFELRPGPPGIILWSIMQQYRHLVPLNPEGFPANDNLLLIDPAPGVEPRLLAALLNSHVQALLKGMAGRWRNEGMLKMQAGDLRRMLVPDPRRLAPATQRRLLSAWEAIAARRVGKIPAECRREDRARLDRATLRGLGLDPARAEAIRLRLCAELTGHSGDERQWELDAQARRRRARASMPAAPASSSAPTV